MRNIGYHESIAHYLQWLIAREQARLAHKLPAVNLPFMLKSILCTGKNR